LQDGLWNAIIGLITRQSLQCCGNPGKNDFSEGLDEDTSNENILRSTYPFSLLDDIGPRKVPTRTVSCKPKSERLHHQFHVSATHFRQCATVRSNALCGDGVYVDAILNGKKVELFGGVDKHQALLIVPGDYRAMLPKKPRASSTEVLFQPYYVLLPDKTAWPCEITGFSE
jgi:hypothetical protein